MGKFTVIPQNTFEELQLDAGVLLKTFDPETAAAPDDEDIICATTGGISVVCVPAYSDMGADIDNCPNNTMELKKLDSWDCRMSFTALNANAETIKLALGACEVSGNSIKPTRDVEQSAFTDVWWVGDRADGGMVAVCLKNSLSTSGLSLRSTKNGKSQMSIELTGHISIKAQDVMPVEFYVAEG